MKKRIKPSYVVLLVLMFTLLLTLERIFVPFNSFSMFTSILGIGSLVAFVYFAEFSMDRLGVTLKREKVVPALLQGFLVPIVSIVIVLLVEQCVWKITGHSGLFFKVGSDFYYNRIQNSSLLYVGVGGFLKWMLIGLGVSLVRSVFYEIGFRGFCFNENVSVQFNNLIQSIAYMIMAGTPTVLLIAVNAQRGKFADDPSWVVPVFIAATLVHLLIFGIRQGNQRRMTGSIWACVISFWIFDYFLMSFKSVSVFPDYMTIFVPTFRALAVQIVAIILDFPVAHWHRKKMREELAPSIQKEVDVDKIVADIMRRDFR